MQAKSTVDAFSSIGKGVTRDGEVCEDIKTCIHDESYEHDMVFDAGASTADVWQRIISIAQSPRQGCMLRGRAISCLVRGPKLA